MAKWGTKNPPIQRGRYLVTLKTPFGLQVRQADRVKHPDGSWYWFVLPSGEVETTNIIAWQKCPEPYKEGNK